MVKLMRNPKPSRTKATPSHTQTKPVVVFALPSTARSRDSTEPVPLKKPKPKDFDDAA